MTYKVEQGNKGEDLVQSVLESLQGELVSAFFRIYRVQVGKYKLILWC